MYDLMKKSTAFGDRLRFFREEQALTLAEVASRAGMNLYSLSKLERGERSPTWETVVALAAALGVTPNDFLEKPPEGNN